MKITVGLIGFGRMGRFYLEALKKSDRFDVTYICDINAKSRELAHQLSPESKIIDNEDEIFNDPSVQLVTLCTLANFRKEQIEKAVRTGKHIISEKPIADTIDREWAVVDLVKDYDKFSTVNMYLLNSWYHNTIKEFIQTGEIGELAIVRICHMTPGLAPGEGHEYEGPAFHDCGMHYVGLAKWYAESEFKTWHAQGVKMWNYKDPWWIQCHGTFENGVVYDITQGFVYGQLCKKQTHNSYVDIIGTKGIARMTHDFRTAHVELHGVTKTAILDKPFGGKNIDKLVAEMANSIETGTRDPQMPNFEYSASASEYAWKFFQDSFTHELPAIGDLETLEKIRERRRHMTNGYGLLPHRNECD